MRLKTDSFVVESNVHFPTDYNLLWDCARKCLDTVSIILSNHEHLSGWRKISNWRYELKGLMREPGKAGSGGGKNKPERVKAEASRYLSKANALVNKLDTQLPLFPICGLKDLALIISLEHFLHLMKKHIDLVGRRVLKGETIPHEEKIFSIFEQYTGRVKKGKMRPNVELGKKLSITTDQFDLIVVYRLLEHHEQDRDIVIELADRLLSRYNISSWSFDKGFWTKDNKALLMTCVPNVIMPRLGRKVSEEQQQENSKTFKRQKNKHSAIESNINELDTGGLIVVRTGVLITTKDISLWEFVLTIWRKSE